jgi:hypothetical protein
MISVVSVIDITTLDRTNQSRYLTQEKAPMRYRELGALPDVVIISPSTPT